MEVKITIEIEIGGEKKTLTYEEGERIYNDLKKVYDRTITIGGREFWPPPDKWPTSPWTIPPTVMYGVMTPPTTTYKE